MWGVAPLPPGHIWRQWQTTANCGAHTMLALKWGSAIERASFFVIMGLVGTRDLIGLDLIAPLRVRIDATSCTAKPQPVYTPQAQEDTSQSHPCPRLDRNCCTDCYQPYHLFHLGHHWISTGCAVAGGCRSRLNLFIYHK